MATSTLPPPSMKSVMALTFKEPPNSEIKKEIIVLAHKKVLYMGIGTHLSLLKLAIMFFTFIFINQILSYTQT